MELLYKDEAIGQIINSFREEYWVHGKFIPYNTCYKYKDFIDAIVAEEAMDSTQFDKELLNENNWFIKTATGIKGIWIPAIYFDDGEISIRYR